MLANIKFYKLTRQWSMYSISGNIDWSIKNKLYLPKDETVYTTKNSDKYPIVEIFIDCLGKKYFSNIWRTDLVGKIRLK